MKTKQADRQFIHWIPFTLPESFTDKPNMYVEKSDQSKFQFVTIGKFVERKNILMMVEVFSKNQKFKDSNCELIIIGECTTLEHRLLLQKLEQLLQSCGVANKIKVLRNLNHEEVQKILRKSQVFLLQSTKEPASISILEAMGNANVLILNPKSGTASYPGDNYGSFASSTQLELNDCIERVLTDKALVKRMQIRSEEIFADYFSNKVVGLQLYDFLFQDKV
jgi:glycosyltransferase involved in cell wall biosynthesis